MNAVAPSILAGSLSLMERGRPDRIEGRGLPVRTMLKMVISGVSTSSGAGKMPAVPNAGWKPALHMGV